MRLNNGFKRYAVHQVWLDRPYCAICSSNQGCALHHIYGRKGEYNWSIYNGVMLCDVHHRQADCYNTMQTGDERRVKLLAIAIKQIAKSDYIPISKDKYFLNRLNEDYLKALKMV